MHAVKSTVVITVFYGQPWPLLQGHCSQLVGLSYHGIPTRSLAIWCLIYIFPNGHSDTLSYAIGSAFFHNTDLKWHFYGSNLLFARLPFITCHFLERILTHTPSHNVRRWRSQVMTWPQAANPNIYGGREVQNNLACCLGQVVYGIRN